MSVRIDREDALSFLLALGRRAADAMMRIYAQGNVAVEYKGKDDPVTIADRESNALLCEAIGRKYPGVPIVAEESDPATFAGWADAKAAWFVDPLDGTREFIARNGEFAVMIGLAEEGRATLGVLVCPALGRDFVGATGTGAFEVTRSGAKRELRVSTVGSLAEAEIVVSRSHRPSALDDGTSQAPPGRGLHQGAAARLGVRKVTPCGSAGVKAARVAAAEADIYAQPGRAGKLWDACAPEAIVRAAGGTVTDEVGAPYDYARGGDLTNSRGLIVTNGKLHQAVLDLVRVAGQGSP